MTNEIKNVILKQDKIIENEDYESLYSLNINSYFSITLNKNSYKFIETIL
jgi:hypothetical protein